MKIKIRNVKTGKIAEITESAWRQLKAGGHSKNYDIISQPTVNVVYPQTPAPTIQQIQEIKNEIVEIEKTIETPEQFIQANEEIKEKIKRKTKKNKE